MQSFQNAYYIKLGSQGRWAEGSIRDGLLRFGWSAIPLADMHAGNWTAIRKRLGEEHVHKGTATSDTERLRDILSAGPKDIWITFHSSRLCWCRLDDSSPGEDAESRFRRVLGQWSGRDARNRLLLASQLPGKIAALHGLRATVCSVHEKEALRRVLAAETSESFDSISSAREELVKSAALAIQHLHWKELETLADLIFRQAG